MNDSGRVHELIQGRALITPDELIGLKNEVIVFAPDTSPLKLPLTSPTAYEQALAYDPPEREKHSVSEFVKKRGRISHQQEEREKQDQPPNKKWRREQQYKKQNRSDKGKQHSSRKDRNDFPPRTGRNNSPVDRTAPDFD